MSAALLVVMIALSADVFVVCRASPAEIMVTSRAWIACQRETCLMRQRASLTSHVVAAGVLLNGYTTLRAWL